MADIKPLADVVAVGFDTPDALRQTQAGSGASFPLLSDTDLSVTNKYNMKLRPDWPMGGMGAIPEMGYVIIGPDGKIRAQRVDLNYGDNANDILWLLRQTTAGGK